MYKTALESAYSNPEIVGLNGGGYLGYDDKIQRPSSKLPKMGVFLPPVELGNLPVVGIAAGGSHTCVMFQACDTNLLKCFGATLLPPPSKS